MLSTSDSSISDAVNDRISKPVRKRYKRFLYTDFSPHDVKKRTKRKWRQKEREKNEKSETVINPTISKHPSNTLDDYENDVHSPVENISVTDYDDSCRSNYNHQLVIDDSDEKDVFSSGDNHEECNNYRNFNTGVAENESSHDELFAFETTKDLNKSQKNFDHNENSSAAEFNQENVHNKPGNDSNENELSYSTSIVNVNLENPGDNIQNNSANTSIYTDDAANNESSDSDNDNESIASNNNEESFNEDHSSSSDDGLNQRNADNCFNTVMFAASGLKVEEVIVLITAFSLRYSLSDEAKVKLANLIKFIAGPDFNDLNLSKYMMNKCFSSQEENIFYHYYCTECEDSIIHSRNAAVSNKSFVKSCEKCNKKNVISTASTKYFISIDLSYQLKQLLSSNNFLFEDILKNSDQDSSNNLIENNTMKDVNDGILHKNIVKSHSNKNESEVYLTVNFNTDGAPLSKSNKRGFWPSQIILNNLSSKLRSSFILLIGILIVSSEPKGHLLNLYLSKVLIDQLMHLHTNGIKITKNNVTYIIKVCLLSCIVDSVCRPIIQQRLQFNGYSGCSWCYQLGKYINTVKGIRYIVDQDSFLRSNESHAEDVKKNSNSGTIVRGVRGRSTLYKIPHFDMIWSFTYEYMHGILLGVTHHMWNLWKNGANKDFKISKNNVQYIEKRFLNITPTHDIHRLPRKGIIFGSSKPKASELKSWLLTYSLPCLKGFLNEEALEHYALLVKCTYILLKQEITEEELVQCEQDLQKFVFLFEYLYGEEQMTFNVHALLHVVESVRQTGPLYVNSAFPYESNIGKLKTFVTGPKGADRQMARKHLQTLLFKVGSPANTLISVKTTNYCKKLFGPKRLTKYYEQNEEKVTFCGKSIITQIDGEYHLIYKKCIYNHVIYHSIKYERAKKTDDTVVLLHSGDFGRILHIVNKENQCYFYIGLIKPHEYYPFEGVFHIRKVEYEKEEIASLVHIDSVKEKVLLVNTKNARYLCTLPNTVEIQ